jgi:hypothetical protein
MRHRFWIPLLLAGCAGGGSARYSDADNQRTISADLDTSFSLSLPASMTAKPAYSPNVLALTKDAVDMSQRRTLEFAAKGLGETELKVGADFSLRVKVTSASDRPGMHVHTR